MRTALDLGLHRSHSSIAQPQTTDIDPNQPHLKRQLRQIGREFSRAGKCATAGLGYAQMGLGILVPRPTLPRVRGCDQGHPCSATGARCRNGAQDHGQGSSGRARQRAAARTSGRSDLTASASSKIRKKCDGCHAMMMKITYSSPFAPFGNSPSSEPRSPARSGSALTSAAVGFETASRWSCPKKLPPAERLRCGSGYSHV